VANEAADAEPNPYRETRLPRSEFVVLRGLRYHVRTWEPVPGARSPGTLVLLHGWMDVSASFQFLVDSLAKNWRVLAPDWRGFGETDPSGADCYWFPDYLGDLDALLDALLPGDRVNLVGHSMGGNVAMIYAGVRPERVSKVVNLEGLGLHATRADEAPVRYARWLDEIRAGARLRDYASLGEVAQRLMANNRRLAADRARYLASHWARPGEDGRYRIAGDPGHKIVNPYLYQVREVLACWRRITADVLFVFAHHTGARARFLASAGYRRRLESLRSLRTATLDDAGHMMHHDQPAEVAHLIEDFVS
jgi:pimeloyl-ACP methyl ester carboxylesterase